MKKMKPNKYTLLLLSAFFLFQYYGISAQEKSPGKVVVKLHYYNNQNSLQYLILEDMLKVNKTLTPRKNAKYELYLDSVSSATLIAKMKTNEKGKAKAFIPASLKANWDASPQHTFIVMAGDEEIISDYIITRSKMTIDTATTDGVRNINVTLMKWENNTWVPSPEVEMKIGIARNGGSILSAGDEDTYTTDSTGIIMVELKKDSLPGDVKGNYVLASRIEDNEEFGNVLAEKTVPWGLVQKIDNSFFQKRTLWTTRNRTPIWLLLLAYSIIIGVWGTLVYLVVQLFKIKKLGEQTTLQTSSGDTESDDLLIKMAKKT